MEVYFQELEGLNSAQNGQELKQYGIANTNRFSEKYCKNGSLNQYNMKILEHLQSPNMWTLLAADSLVRTYPLREKVLELQENVADYGVRCGELLGKLDPNSSSLKTAQCLLFEDSSKCYTTFTKSGMMRNGNVYQVQHLDCNKVESGYIVLPTPVKSCQNAAAKHRFFGSPTYRSNYHEFIRDGEQDGTYPNPNLIEVLMTYPEGWTELEV